MRMIQSSEVAPLDWPVRSHSRGAIAQTGATKRNSSPRRCWSCTPARDARRVPRRMRCSETYVKTGEVIALTLPVDYWDYLGWKDTLADGSLYGRQKRLCQEPRRWPHLHASESSSTVLAHANGAHAERHRPGHRQDDRPSSAGERVPVRLSIRTARSVIEAGAMAEGDKTARGTCGSWPSSKEVQVPVRKGENKGRR